MTQKAPERIVTRHYANGIINARPSDEGFIISQGNEIFDAEYTLTDHALALVAAALEPWVNLRDESRGVTGFHLSGNEADWDEFDLPELDADAQAALEAIKQEARNEAAEVADKLGWHCIGCGHICGDPEKDMRLLKKAGALSCCPERQMEPLSAAILTLITEDQSDA